ncbi:D-alanyl-D-alanine carboxypeptidase family protein, partial [Microbacterium sp.]|uniref:D-alanyl-D-alanine carboxypeptidase family protein n=1 Tax=Microbacterium sp. TaxID=51671 RepID=UPI003C710F0B
LPSLPADGAAAVRVEGAAEFLGSDGLSAAAGTADPLPIASITKLVTALTVLDAHPLAGPGDPGPTLTFDKADHDLYDQYYVQGATIAEMPTGSTMSLHDALELMLVVSASNYADAVSTWAFGSPSGFVRAARDWLARNGLAQTVIVEPTGISARNVSTTTDLIALGKLAMANETVASIVGMTSLDVHGFTGRNTNTLLGSDGVRGIKTGTLEGSNLLYSSLLDAGIGEPLHVTGIVLGGQDRDSVNAQVEALLDSIRAGFHDVPVATKGEVYGSYETPWGAHARMVMATDAEVLTWSDTPISAEMSTTALSAGKAGEKVGSITWTAGPRTASADLVLDGDIAPPDAWWRLAHPFELGG